MNDAASKPSASCRLLWRLPLISKLMEEMGKLSEKKLSQRCIHSSRTGCKHQTFSSLRKKLRILFRGSISCRVRSQPLYKRSTVPACGTLSALCSKQPEYHRMSNSSEADERTLYVKPFRIRNCVKKAQPYTFMCSYNQINGTFASENKWLLTDVLRSDWGFKGYVMSDWGAVNDRVKGLEAGLDLEMPSSNGVNDSLIVQAVKDGSLKEDILDEAVERILRIIFEYTDNRAPQDFTMEKDHEEARHIAEESMVLLKNDMQILPLKASEKVAFIGGFAKKPRFQGGGSSHINCFKITNALDSVPSDAQVTYAEGFPADKDLYDDALAAEAI